MVTNANDPRTTGRTGDNTTVTDPTPTPVVNPTGVGGVAVFDQDADGTPSNRTLRTSSSMATDHAPVETRSGGSMLSWIIGAIVLIVLAYFLIQIIF
jgi:hypothetical protein